MSCSGSMHRLHHTEESHSHTVVRRFHWTLRLALPHHQKRLSSETTKREILFLLALFVGAATAYFWVRSVQLPLLRAPDGHYVLADPDSFVRWRLVERALSGEGVRIHWMTEDNAPYGRLNGWTSPTTILGVTLVRSAECLGGMSQAEALEWSGLWLGPIVGLMSIVALGFLGWRVGGWLLAACWMLAWPALIDVMSITGFGNTDHHSLHQLLFICVMGGCLAWSRRPTRAGGVFVGLACAMLIWSAGLEVLPAWALVAGLGFCELSWRSPVEGTADFWRAWWVSGLLGTMVAWLFEFWPHVFHGHLEFISVWHVASWAIVGTVLELAGRPRVAVPWKLAAAVVGAGLALLAGAATRGFDWHHLHIVQDVRLKRLMSVTAECMPYPRSLPRAVQQGCIDFGFLPLVAATLVIRVRELDPRVRWLGLATVVYAVLMFFQVRWLDFFMPLLVMTAGVALTRLRGRDPVLCLVVVLVATIPPWLVNLKVAQNVKLVGADLMHGPFVETFALRSASDCLGASEDQPVVLAPWEESSVLAGLGKVKVIGSGFWSNLDGLADTFKMLTTTSETQFWELVRKRKVRYVLLRSPKELEQDVRQSFVASSGKVPTRSEVREAYVWQLRSDARVPAISCEGMSRLEPTWRIVRLNGVTRVPAGHE